MERTKSARFIEQASGVAAYYGFRPLKALDPELYRKEVGRAPLSFNNAASLCAECAFNKREEPVLAYWATPAVSHTPAEIPVREAGEFSLQVAGCPQSIGEIVVLKTMAAILTDWGTPITRVRVNALGDRESRERFARELSLFLKRRLGTPLQDLEEEERERLLKEPLSAYTSLSPVIRELMSEAPRPVHYLSERSRAHFKELLEHLEQVELPYELDDTLAGDEREPRTIFRIDTDSDDSLVFTSQGGRFDDFVARLSGRREPSAVHASIYFRKRGGGRIGATELAIAPKVYFVQLGTKAKLRGLSVIDMLRRAQIPVAQSFDTRRLAPQLQAAQSLSVPYVLIMGEREALDGTVIVRSTRNSSQTIVGLLNLPRHLRTLKV